MEPKEPPFKGGEALNKSRVHTLIGNIRQDTQMAPAKRALLLANLNDQLVIPGNGYAISQRRGTPQFRGQPFDYSYPQRYNPAIRSSYQAGNFTLADARGGGAIVDFANDKFGGGILGPRGFAQEEKLLLETNLVVKAGEYAGLSHDPLHIQTFQTHEFVGPGRTLYGNSQMGSRGNTIDKAPVTAATVDRYLRKVRPPKPINVVAMAAIDMRKSGRTEYTFTDLRQMFGAAYKAFQAHAEKGGNVVHTGAWGAGAFGNSENVTATLQILAAQAAGVRLIYHGSQEAYDSTLRFLRNPRIAGHPYGTVFDSLVNHMQKGHPNSEFWKPK